MRVRLPRVKLPTEEITPEMRKAGRLEARAQIVEQQREYDLDAEAAFMWAVHISEGYGLKRLLRLRERIITETEHMRERFLTDEVYPQRMLLKELGYDVEELQRRDKR